ncbi:MAG: membrane protein, partial [Acidobacteria bacterium]
MAIALTLGVGGRAVPIALWALYLSCITAGRDFFYYQWDNLLLEASFLAIFLPARGSLFGLARGRRPPEPSRIVVFLLQWLLFRLLFE